MAIPADTRSLPLMCFACGRNLTPDLAKCPDCGAPTGATKARRRIDGLKVAGFVLGSLAIIAGVFGGFLVATPDEFVSAGTAGLVGGRVTFSGSVFNESGARMANVTITESASANASTTDENGTFYIPDRTTGFHRFTFNASNHTAVVVRTFLVADESADIELSAGNGTTTQDHASYTILKSGINFCGSFILGVALLCVAGSVACARRRNYGLALTAGIASFLVTPIFPFALILSVAAVWLTVRNKKQFR